jgi:hypothetical protein
MTPTEVRDAYEAIVGRCATALADAGYSRSGSVLRKLADGNAAIVEFQKSSASTGNYMRFTVNVGIASGELSDPELPVTKRTSLHAHLREQIGKFLPGRPDKWWTIEPGSEISAIADEVAALITDKAIPFLEEYVHTEELVQLWRSGSSPGLTETQRNRYLQQLGATESDRRSSNWLESELR